MSPAKIPVRSVDQPDADLLAGRHAERDQPAGEPVDLGVDLPERPALSAERQRLAVAETARRARGQLA